MESEKELNIKNTLEVTVPDMRKNIDATTLKIEEDKKKII